MCIMNVCVQFITNFITWRYLIRTHCGVHLFRILARNMRAQIGPQHPASCHMFAALCQRQTCHCELSITKGVYVEHQMTIVFAEV